MNVLHPASITICTLGRTRSKCRGKSPGQSVPSTANTLTCWRHAHIEQGISQACDCGGIAVLSQPSKKPAIPHLKLKSKDKIPTKWQCDNHTVILFPPNMGYQSSYAQINNRCICINSFWQHTAGMIPVLSGPCYSPRHEQPLAWERMSLKIRSTST